ncbi:MAG: ABC transporter ATP-binding protein [Actinobacteria bacterium]|nr:ABC transporter ATP-binding protein [Actinomycetota bacterium]
MISVKNLTKEFETVVAVQDISFDIDEGEIFGFLGPNGAGKTTTIRMLSTLISPTSGSITIDDKDPKTGGEHIRSIIGLLTESPGLYEKISAYDNLDYFSSFYDMPDKQRKANIEKYLKMFGLWQRKDDLAGTYSKGMKQKLALTRALIHEPRILFLDEPTAGLDPESAHMVRSFIESLKKEKITIFLCTHNLTEASNLSGRICFIKKKIIKIASLGELQNHDKHRKVEIVFRDDATRFLPVLKNIKNILEVDTNKNKAILLVSEPEKSNPGIIRELTSNNIDILYLNEIKASLEEIYLDLIKDEETK